MRRFAALYRRLERSAGTLEKRAALIDYFAEAPAEDAVWALWLLCGGKFGGKRRIASSGELRAWVAEETATPPWLVDASYEQVGDLAETLSLLVNDPPVDHAPADSAQAQHTDLPLHVWIEQRLLPVAGADAEVRRAVVVGAWRSLDRHERLCFNKLLTGALRVGVSQRLVQQALAESSGVDIALIAQRMLGDWTPTVAFLHGLRSAEAQPGDRAQPYPFFLASPLEGAVDALGPPDDWLLEWKWDGIRLQLIRRDDDLALWSRGEERLDGRFPEIETAAAVLARSAVLDGELLIWPTDDARPASFAALQTRIQRRKPGATLLQRHPARMLAYDLLEMDGEDLRAQPLHVRRVLLAQLLADSPAAQPTIALSPALVASDWQEAAAQRARARGEGVEGLMLKRASSPYQSGRRRGDWWKWKLDPLSVDAVLLYAQAGHGRRSTLYTDYTFGVWDGERLVPVAKAYSGLDDAEILRLDRWIRAHTLEKFGPVRSVAAEQVFELGFEAVMRSNRHKSGVAVRFPRILRWREDKRAQDADHIDSLRALAS
jgi:DNA ligase-1